MNKAITDGILFMPPPFLDGLDVWSSGDGTPGAATYDGASNAALVPSDSDFGGCLELLKTSNTQKLRYTGETPILPGCYLRITARIKAMSGALPSVRIAAWAGSGTNTHVAGVIETGPEVAITTYGEVIEVSAIVATGTRPGVDMPWGNEPILAHVGLDLTGNNGGTVRIDDLVVEDITSAFLRDMLAVVDVRDYGAVGDGVTDDRAAFAAADAAAAGRTVLISEGSYFIGSNITLTNAARFEGTLVMPDDARLALIRSFDLPTYIDAFGDETLGFKKALQALFNYTDHESLDMKGRRIDVTEPIDVQAAVNNLDTLTVRRVIRNGQFYVQPSSAWDTEVHTSQATYSTSAPMTLSNVASVANIPVGSLVEGTGVGREVYVKAVNVGAGTVTLSQPLFDAVGTQVFTFKRFKYILDFSGMANMDKFILSNVDFQCNSESSAIMLPPTGLNFQILDCYLTRPKDRGITSIGRGCQGLHVERCQFLSAEQALPVSNRVTVAMNINANDTKIRNNRAMRFLHFCITNGGGHIYSGNHFFQGDEENNGTRSSGLVFTQINANSIVDGNYIDNCPIEWSNEHDYAPEFSNEYSFGGLTVTDNIFVSIDVAAWFRWIVIKPHGAGHFLHGFTMTGNTFKAINGNIDRVDKVDTSYADLDMSRARNVLVEGNTFNGIDQLCASPVTLQFDQNSDAKTWTLNFGAYLPFGSWARNVASVVTENAITSGGSDLFAFPYTKVEQGSNKDQIKLVWPSACKGRVHVTARMDNPN